MTDIPGFGGLDSGTYCRLLRQETSQDYTKSETALAQGGKGLQAGLGKLAVVEETVQMRAVCTEETTVCRDPRSNPQFPALSLDLNSLQ